MLEFHTSLEYYLHIEYRVYKKLPKNVSKQIMIKRRSGEKQLWMEYVGIVLWIDTMVNKMWIPDSWTTSRVPVHKHKYR